MLSSAPSTKEPSSPLARGISFPVSTLLALLTTALLVLPQLAAFFASEGFSPRAFSDWDEPLYLTVLKAVGEAPLALLKGGLPAGVELPLGFPYPHALTDIVLGALTSPLSLSPIELGLVFDILCIPLAFFALRSTFRHLTTKPFVPELAAILCLMLPWFMPLSRYLALLFPSLNTGAFILAPSTLYPCQPILRGAYTQFSYAIFPWVLTLLLRGRTRDVVGAGILAGCLLYIYLFSWMTFLVVGGLLALLLVRLNGTGERVFFRPALFLGSALLLSTPGVIFLLATHSPTQYQLDQGPTWYLPPEILMLLMLFVRQQTKLGTLGTALCLAELLLMNVQNVTGHLLEPHHFITFYLHPLLGGIVAVAILSRVRWSSTILLPAMLLPLVILSVLRSTQSLALEHQSDLSALLRVITAATPPTASVVSVPFEEPFIARGAELSERRLLPYWLQAITGRKGFPQGDGCVAELFTAWLYRGEAIPIGSCPTERRSTEDAVLSALPFHQLRRFDECKKLHNAPAVCELLANCHADFTVFEDQLIPSPPAQLTPFFTEEWRGDSHSLWRFNHPAAQAALCAPPVQPRDLNNQ